MGMFDSVIAVCPKCNKEVEFQSKAGECLLRNYSANSVPPDIAQDIEGDTSPCECGYVLRIVPARPIERVSMVIEDGSRTWD